MRASQQEKKPIQKTDAGPLQEHRSLLGSLVLLMYKSESNPGSLRGYWFPGPSYRVKEQCHMLTAMQCLQHNVQ